jgi:glycosyltransferase involved in cell wall biosynthesis
VDNFSSDGTPEIAATHADLVLQAGPERSAQRNRGAEALPSEVLAFIDSDMILTETVIAQAVDALNSGAGSVIVPEQTVGEGFWVSVRAFERSFYQGDDRVEAARIFRWSVFQQANGYDEGMTGGEDWDLALRTRHLAPVARTTAFLYHDEGRLSYFQACRKKATYASGLRRYLHKHGGATTLTYFYDRPWMHHPSLLSSQVGVGLLALKVGEAGAVGLRLIRDYIAARKEIPVR